VNPEETHPAALTGAYALDAVNDDERAALEEFLRESESTRNEVTELKDTAVLLGLAAAPVTPTASLKANLMAQIATTPQFAPLRAVEPVAEPVIEPAHFASTSTSEHKAQSRWFSRPVIAITSAAAAVVILLGGGFVVSQVLAPTTNAPQQASGIAAIRAADDAQEASAEVAGGGTATLVWSNELATAALIADDLPALTEDQVYELWYIGESGPRPAGTFTVDESGAVSQILEGDMQAGDLVGVTIEPAGGSEQPTTDPIVGIQA
jgi:anti-sigma-K factor RskA